MTLSNKATIQIANAISKEVCDELNKKVFTDTNAVSSLNKVIYDIVREKFNNQIDETLGGDLSLFILENLKFTCEQNSKATYH